MASSSYLTWEPTLILLAMAAITGCDDSPASLPPPPSPDQGMTTAGEVRESIDSQLSLIQSDPEDLSMRAELAMIYQANALPRTAISTWNQILQVETENPRYWYMLAQAQHDMGRYESATSTMAIARRLSPESAQLWWQPAFWSIDLGQASEAERLARQSIKIDPDNAGGYVSLALAMMELERPNEARLALEQLRIKVDHPYIRHLIGQTHRRQGESELAASWLALGDARQPNFPDPWQVELQSHRRGIDAMLDRIDELLEQKRNDEAAEIIHGAMKKWPSDINLQHRRSELYRRKGDLKRWLMTLRNAEKLEPENAATHLNLSMAYEKNNDPSQAMTHVVQAIRLNHSMTAAHLQMGRLQILSNNIPQAAISLDTAFELGVEDPRERLQYAHVLLRARRPTDAQREARLVTRINPRDPLGWCVLAEALYAQGKRSDAMNALSDGLAILPGNDSIMMIRARFDAFEKQAR